MAKVDRIEKIVTEENSDNDPMEIELLSEFKDALIGVCRVERSGSRMGRFHLS